MIGQLKNPANQKQPALFCFFAFLLLAGALILTTHKALVFKSAKWALCTRGVYNLNQYKIPFAVTYSQVFSETAWPIITCDIPVDSA